MKTIWGLVASLTLLTVSCSHLKLKKPPQKTLRVLDLGTQRLTEPVPFETRGSLTFGPRKIRSAKIWEWRGRYALGAPMQSFTAPEFMGGDELLVSTLGGGIGVWDLRLSKYKWEKQIAVGVASQPLVLNASVIVAGMDAKVRSLRKANGEEEWVASIGTESLGGISAALGFVFVNASDDSLWALDEKTGRSLWTYKRPSPEGILYWSLRGQAIPLLSPDGKRVYVGFSDGTFVCLEASSGQTLWERKFERTGRFKDVDTTARMSADARTLYVSVVDGEFLALKASDGSTLWSLGGASAAAPTLDENEGVLYLSTSDSQLQKVSLKDGNILWSYGLGGRGLATSATLIGKSHVAISASHGGLMIFDRRMGRLVWEYSFGLGSLAPPIFDGKRLVALTSRNVLHLYRVDELK